MIVANDQTHIKITESKENIKTEPGIPKILEKRRRQPLAEKEQVTVEPLNAVVVELPLTEKQRAEVELFKQLINS